MAKIHKMWQAYPDLMPELNQTLDLMTNNIQTTDSAVTAAILEMINSGGKLLRPAYCLLFSRYKEADRTKMIALAASVETLHTATLIHDDIVDESDIRRQLPTISAQFGKSVAVYAGDYLFVVVFKILSNYSSSLRSIQLNSKSMEKILIGEINQMSMRYNLDMTMEQYMKQVNGKTAQLFAVSSFIGAFESGNTEKFARNAQDIGLNIGLAFQIMDDVLDYSQTEDTFGKPVLEDMRQGVYSAPLILAMEKDKAPFIPLLSKKLTMTTADTKQVAHLVNDLGGVQAAHQLAVDYTEKALKLIQKLPAGETTDTITRLTKQILNREF